jgi:outer membrane translocation and assembly module TamA
VALRGERHEALPTSTDFSVWNGDDTFRANRAAQEGRLRAFIIGASVDSLTFERESLDTTYRRHHFEAPFGARLTDPTGKRDAVSLWRLDWTSELSTPDLLSSDFDFRRHIVSGRASIFASRYQEVGARAIAGWSAGVLPPQREFSMGGIGSVHGYDFKTTTGDAMQVVNVLGWHNGLQLLAFVDAGRTTRHSETLALAGAGSPWLKGAGWGIGVGPVRVDFGYPLRKGSHPLQVLVRIGRTF